MQVNTLRSIASTPSGTASASPATLSSMGSTLLDTAYSTARSLAEFGGCTLQALKDIGTTAGNSVFRAAQAAVDDPRVGNVMMGTAATSGLTYCISTAVSGAAVEAALRYMQELGYDTDVVTPEFAAALTQYVSAAAAAVTPLITEVEALGRQLNGLLDAAPAPVRTFAPVLGTS